MNEKELRTWLTRWYAVYEVYAVPLLEATDLKERGVTEQGNDDAYKQFNELLDSFENLKKI